MSNFFNEYYDKQQSPKSNSGVLIVEVNSKSMGKRFLNTIAKIFGKKSENVNIKNKKVEEVTRTSFNELASKLATNLLSSKKKDNKYYVKHLYKGNIQDPKTLDPDYVKTNSSSVFVLSNGAKIYLISINDKEGITSHFIGTDNPNKANDFFTEYFGRTFDLYLSSKRIIRKKRKNNKIIDEPTTPFHFDPEPEDGEPESTRSHKPEPKKQTEIFGIINTNVETVDQLIDKLGNGSVGYGIFKNTYKYKNVIKRQSYETKWGKGYKYNLNGNMYLYLLKGIDNPNNAKILFNNKAAYSRANKLNMLPWFNPNTKIQWQELNIENI